MSSTNAQKRIKARDYFDYVSPEELELHQKYLKEIIKIVEEESRKIARKQVTRTNLTDNKIKINWWMEDTISYSVLREMIGGYKIELPSTDDTSSIIIVFRPYVDYLNFRYAALRILNPSLPNESHRAYDISLLQLIGEKDGFGKLESDDLTNNRLFYDASKKMIEDYINGREIKNFTNRVFPGSIHDHLKPIRSLNSELEKARIKKRKETDSSEIFPDHIIFQQIDVLLNDSDGIKLDLIENKEKQFKKFKGTNKSLFFCDECSEYFECSGIPPWPKNNFPSKASRKLGRDYKPPETEHKSNIFNKIVNDKKCPGGHSFPFIMRGVPKVSLSNINDWFNWHYLGQEGNNLPLPAKLFNYKFIIDGNFESQINTPPSVMNQQDYSNWDIRIQTWIEEMYRPFIQHGHIHNKKCITNIDYIFNTDISTINTRSHTSATGVVNFPPGHWRGPGVLKHEWKASNFQFIIEKMNKKGSTAISIDTEEYSEISYNPKEKCQFNWQVLGFGIYDGKGRRKWGKELVSYSKLRDINQPIEVKYILLGQDNH